jgi:hypothetical protein
MAQTFGQAGRFATEATYGHTKRIVATAFFAVGIVAFLCGYALSGVFPLHGLPLAWTIFVSISLCLGMWIIGEWATTKIDSIDRKRMAWRTGAVGEAIVGATLAELPDDFVVVNDVPTRFGNIDHVVIGPTGVYLIDAKNWRGTVSSNGNGELQLNGRMPPKPAVKSLLGGVMDFRTKVNALTNSDYFIRGLLVFPNAYVEASFGSTRQIHCLRNDRLVTYLQEQRAPRKLTSSEINQLKLATLRIATIKNAV